LRQRECDKSKAPDSPGGYAVGSWPAPLPIVRGVAVVQGADMPGVLGCGAGNCGSRCRGVAARWRIDLGKSIRRAISATSIVRQSGITFKTVSFRTGRL